MIFAMTYSAVEVRKVRSADVMGSVGSGTVTEFRGSAFVIQLVSCAVV